MSFLREKEVGGPLLPLTALYERIAEAMKVSMRTVFNAKKGGMYIHIHNYEYLTILLTQIQQMMKMQMLNQLLRQHLDALKFTLMKIIFMK
jgi:Rad3-related DNA helicase